MSSRRNTDPPRSGDLQYRTPRGPLAVRVVEADVRRAPDPRDTRRSGYPRVYRNQEGHPPDVHQNFRDDERRGDESFYEVPVAAPHFDFDRRPATLQQVERNRPENLNRNDRRRATENRPVNDPGAHRAVLVAEPAGGPSRRVGLITHPYGNPTGYERAPLEPIGRDGRAQQARQHDIRDSNHSSWPPRGEPSGGLTRMEVNYERREPRAERRRRR